MKKIVPFAIIAGLLFFGAVFAGYRYVQTKKVSDGTQKDRWQNRGPGGGKNMFDRKRGGIVAGEILAKESDNLTLKLPDGGSKIVFYSGSSKITEYADISAASLAVKDRVAVMGNVGEDGTITAVSVQAGIAEQGFFRVEWGAGKTAKTVRPIPAQRKWILQPVRLPRFPTGALQ